jgi:TRAP-type C4-dicarboxylate transport system substrate-binding protein
MTVRRFLAGAALLVCAVGLAACGGSTAEDDGSADGANKAGAKPAEGRIVLTLASQIQGSPPAPIQAFADEVARRSNGAIRVRIVGDWQHGNPHGEAATIEDVRAGKADLAWVGARVFDTVGVRDFQALLAPFLVDSQAVQQRVFEAGIPARMLDGLDTLDLTGLAVLPGPMRTLLGVSQPFTTAADFAGRTIGIQDSDVARRTFAALGATAEPLPGQASIDAVDGYEQQLGSIFGNHYDGDSVTSNLEFWPRPLVLFTSMARFQQLTPEQQDVLRAAAEAVVEPSFAAARSDDSEGAANLCDAGMKMVEAPPADLAELRQRVEPVYAALSEDATTKAYLQEIQALKQQVPAAAAAPVCQPKADAEQVADATEEKATTGAAESSAVLDGRYTLKVSRDAWIDAVALDPADVPADLGDFTLTLQVADGRFRLDEEPDGWSLVGDARTSGDVMEIETGATEGEPWKLHWSRYRETLRFEADQGMFVPYWFTVGDWQRTGDAKRQDFDRVTEPAHEFPTGVYRRTITDAEVLRAGIKPGEELNYDGRVEMHFGNGTVEVHWLDDEALVDQANVALGDDGLLHWTWPDSGETFMTTDVSHDGAGLHLHEWRTFGYDLGLVGFVTGSWQKVG